MATESVGGVSYSVDVDLGDLSQLEVGVDKATKEVAKDFSNLDKSIGASTAGIKSNVTKTSSAVSSSLGTLGRSAGQVGLQVSQLTGQIQGGTNAFIAISQQAADLGFVLGVPLLGAVVSLAAAIGFSLVNSINDAKEAGKKLPDELNKRLEEIKAGFEETDEVSRRAFAQVELGKLNTELNAITNRINRLKEAQKVYFDLAARGNNGARLDYKRVGEEITELEKQLGPLALLQEKVRLETLGLDQDWKSTGDEVNKAGDAAERFLAQLQLSSVKLAEGEQAALRLAAAQALGLSAAEKLPENIELAISAYVEAKQEAEAEAEFRRQAAADQREALQDIEAERKAAHQQELDRIKAEDEARKQRQQVASDVRFVGASDQQSELIRLADSYAQQQILLQQALDLEIITRQDYAARKIALEQQTQEQINQINQSGTQSLKQQLDSVGFSLDTFQNQAIGAFASVAAGAMSGKEAIRGLAQSILQTAIGALIRLAITSAVGQKAAVATGIATAGALSTAYATPAALASLASFGANAAPASAGITSTVALAQGLSLGTGRLYGGPVSGGKMYPFMEDGKPEALKMGTKTYLWTGGGSGNVISNKDMTQAGGSNSSVTVNVINNASNTDVQERRSQGSDGAQVIEIVVADIQSRGRVHNAITGTTTAGNRI